jgi:putative ABC transport system permease protein
VKYLPLIWSGIWRKRGRTILVMLQIAIAFALFGLLQGWRSGVDAAIDEIDANVFMVYRATGGGPLPLAHFGRLQSVKEVANVQRQSFLGGTYQKPDQNVTAISTDVAILMKDKTSASVVPADAVATMERTRDGVLVGRGLAEKYGWKVGDRISLQSQMPQQNGSKDWTFQVAGIIIDPETWGFEGVLVINWDYLNEARARQQNTVARYIVRMRDPHNALAVAQQIDNMFANSPDETRTESLTESAQNSLRSMGDLNFVVRAIIGAVMFALLFSVAAMMMQSVRERTAELGVLRTLGFSDRKVFWILMAEGIAVCMFAAAVGVLTAERVLPWASTTLGGVSMPGSVVLVGLGIALVLALISAAPPAWRVLRLQVAEALSGR